jgi:hypothetical protein
MVSQDAVSIPHRNGVTMPVLNGAPSAYAAKHNLPAHFIGGNRLDVAASSAVKDFVASHDGHTVITSVSFSLVRVAHGPKQVRFCLIARSFRFSSPTTVSLP